MKHIKKFKLFENKTHPSDYFDDNDSFIDISYSLFYDLHDEFIIYEKLNNSDIIRIDEVIKTLQKKHDLKNLESKSGYLESKSGFECPYIIHITNFNYFDEICISKLVDDYWLIFESTYDDEKAEDSHREEYFLCDGYNGLKEWAEKGYSV
jgi:hypothetical protein